MKLKISKHNSNATILARYNHYKQLCKLNELVKFSTYPICELPLKSQHAFWKTLQSAYHIWSEFEAHLAKHWNDATKLINIETNLFYVYDFGDGDTSTRQLGFSAIAPTLFSAHDAMRSVSIEQILQWVQAKQIVLAEPMFQNAHSVAAHMDGKKLSEQEMLALVNTMPLLQFNGKTTPNSYVHYSLLYPEVFAAFYCGLDLSGIDADILSSASALQHETRKEIEQLKGKRTELDKSLSLAKKAIKTTKQKDWD